MMDDNISSELSWVPAQNLSEYDITVNLTAMQHAGLSLAFIFLAAVGLVTNAWMITILMRMKTTFFTVIITGLSISDIISSLNSPFYIYGQLNKNDFELPYILCLTYKAIDVATSSITAHHVLLLSYIRLRSLTAGSNVDMSVKVIRFILVTSYITSFIINAIISISVMEYRKIGETQYYCDLVKGVGESISLFMILTLTILTLIPSLLIIVFCIVIIGFLLHRVYKPSTVTQSATSREKERKALIQLGAVVISFIIGYSVDYAAKFYQAINDFKIPQDTLMIIILVIHGILRICECANPFLYYLASTDIKLEWGLLIGDIRNRYSACFQTENQPNSQESVNQASTGSENQRSPSRRIEIDGGRNKTDVLMPVTSRTVESTPKVGENLVLPSAEFSPVISNPADSEVTLTAIGVSVALPHSVQADST